MFSLSHWGGEDSSLPSVSADADAASSDRASMCPRPPSANDSSHQHDYPDGTIGTDLEAGSSTPSLCVESGVESARTGHRRRRVCDRVSHSTHVPTTREDEVLTFRPLQASDREEIQRLHEAWFPVDYKEDFYDGVVHNKMASTGQPLYTRAAVVSCPETQQERIIGCIVGAFVYVSKCKSKSVERMVPNPQRHTRMLYITTLGIVKEYRGRRLATTLLEQCFAEIEDDNSCGVSYLHVITYNRAAIQFYEKLGFLKVETIENYYLIDGQNYNCYLYAKYFNGNRGHLSLYKIMRGFISAAFRGISSRLHHALGYAE